jgi:HPt (histidine-containing phosphotransfer) domain-containing protein
MTTRILIVGDPAISRMPALTSPSRWDSWTVEWSSLPTPADLQGAGLVVIDLTASHPEPTDWVGLIARTVEIPRLAVTTGPAAVPGLDTLDISGHHDLKAELFTQLERSRVTAKVRWLYGLGGDDFVGQLLDLVLAEVPKSIAGIVAATDAGDTKAASRIAHPLKSTAGNVGAETINRIAVQIEADAQADNVGTLRELTADLIEAWDRIRPTLVAHRQKARASTND